MVPQRNLVTFDRWLVLVVNQTESREGTVPKQPLDETKETRRFIVLNKKDQRPVFNCIECVSIKQSVNYPDVEIIADQRLFQKDSIARVGYIYTLRKNLHGITPLGFITDIKIQDKIRIGLRFYLPT
jgi:hypothetical protein